MEASGSNCVSTLNFLIQKHTNSTQTQQCLSAARKVWLSWRDGSYVIHRHWERVSNSRIVADFTHSHHKEAIY